MGLVSDHLRVGDKIEVLCTKIDPVQGSIRLSRKKLLRMRKSNVASYSPTSMNQQPGTPPPPLNGLSKSPIPNRIQPTFDNEEEQEAVIISIDGVYVTGDSSEDDESDLQYCAKRLLAIKLWENDNGAMWRQHVKQKAYDILCVRYVNE